MALPNWPGAGLTQASLFNTKVLFGSQQWQLRSTVNGFTPGTRIIEVFWKVRLFIAGLVVACGGRRETLAAAARAHLARSTRVVRLTRVDRAVAADG